MTSISKVVIASPALDKLVQPLSRDYAVIRGWLAQDPAIYLDAGVVVAAGDAPLDTQLLAMMPALRLVVCATRGYDGIDVDRLAAAGIAFSHVENVNEQDVADHALGTMIMHRRALLEGDRLVRGGRWERAAELPNRSFSNARVGIVGLGRIGRAVANRASAMRMSVSWWGPREKPARWPRAGSLIELARESDYLVVAARLHHNVGLVSREVLDALGPTGYLVNVSRGRLVNEDALIEALRDGRLGGAALDVFEQEPTPAARWDGVPNTFLTPHSSGKTAEAFHEMSKQVGTALARFFGTISPESESLNEDVAGPRRAGARAAR